MGKPIVYGRDNSRVEVGEPITHFAGDEPFIASYESALRHQYVGATPVIVELFERQLGRRLTLEQQELIRRTLANVGHLDDLLDECPPEEREAARAAYERLINSLELTDRPSQAPEGLSQQLWNSTGLWHNALATLHPEARQDIIDAAHHIGYISLRKAQNSSVQGHAYIVVEEDAHLADLFVEGLGLNRRSAEYRYLQGLGRTAVVAGGLLHAGLKLIEESRKKLTRVSPTPFTIGYLMGKSLLYMPATLRGIGVKGLRSVAAAKLKSKK